MKSVLFVASGGVGNIIQATSSFLSLIESGYTVDLKLNCNSSKDVKYIFAIDGIRSIYVEKDPIIEYDYQLTGPFSPGKKYKAKKYIKSRINYAQHIPEVQVYFDMVRQIGISGEMQPVKVKIGKTGLNPLPETVAIYPGSKSNWAMKRWDKYDELAQKFKNVLVVGTKDDIYSHGNPAWIKKPWKWPENVRFYTGSLAEMTYTLSRCKCFIGNDGGLAHLAAATGIPTFVLFGPSSDIKNRPFSPKAYVIAIDLPCRPCQFTKIDGKEIFGSDKANCPNNMKCMKEMDVEFVFKKVKNYV